MADGPGRGEGPTEVVLLVCVTCGTEHQLESGETPPDDLSCEKCGGEVFRRFQDAESPDEVRADHAEATGRDLDPDDPPTDTERGDILDLNNA